MKTNPPNLSVDVDLKEACINYMAEIYTLASDVISKYPDWDKTLSTKNRKVIKRVLKIQKGKTN